MIEFTWLDLRPSKATHICKACGCVVAIGYTEQHIDAFHADQRDPPPAPPQAERLDDALPVKAGRDADPPSVTGNAVTGDVGGKQPTRSTRASRVRGRPS